MKCVVLAAGKGTRMQNKEISNKCFIKINRKTLLDYNLELISERYFDEILIVVHHNAENIINYVGYNYNGIPVTYVHQKKLLGIANAIECAYPLINPNSFLMILADEILFNNNIQKAIEYFNSLSLDCLCGTVKDNAFNIKKAYTLRVDEQNNVLDLIEKPKQIFNNMRGTGYCLFNASYLDILNSLNINPIRKEFEMGDWIRLGIEKGLKCKIFNIADYAININTEEDIRNAEKYVAKLYEEDISCQ